jgi:WD40 repeat protein
VFAVTCEFDNTGSLLAVGCKDGKIGIWEVVTRMFIESLLGHVAPITSLSWSATQKRILLSGAADWQIIIWDVQSGEKLFCHVFGSYVLNAQLSPSCSSTFVASVLAENPFLCRMKSTRVQEEHNTRAAPTTLDAAASIYEFTASEEAAGRLENSIVSFDGSGTQVFGLLVEESSYSERTTSVCCEYLSSRPAQ